MSISMGRGRRGGGGGRELGDPLQNQQSHSVGKNHSQMDTVAKPPRAKSQMDGKGGNPRTQSRELGMKSPRK